MNRNQFFAAVLALGLLAILFPPYVDTYTSVRAGYRFLLNAPGYLEIDGMRLLLQLVALGIVAGIGGFLIKDKPKDP